jgi:hypothetical protein
MARPPPSIGPSNRLISSSMGEMSGKSNVAVVAGPLLVLA